MVKVIKTYCGYEECDEGCFWVCKVEDYKSVKRDITKAEPTEDAGYIKTRSGIWFSSEDKIRERLRKTIEF